MIEISHKQARYLLREIEDRRLPDEQWAALQTHLERCPECSAYRDRMAGLEKDLHRGMRGRWSGVNPTIKGLPEQVVAFRAARKQRLKRSLYTALALLVGLAVIVFRWNTSAFTPVPTPSPIVRRASPTPTQVNLFHGLVVFQASPAGNSDIFLLNRYGSSSDELSNLTNDLAQDTDPAWSPDGEWIAFLSDRSGKRELYVINVAGTRLTQMTKDPLIDWQGPLTWSADGKLIALAGRRLAQNNERWLYGVPMAGTGPLSLPGTRNDPGLARFSPSQTMLATTNSVYDYVSGWSLSNWFMEPTLENTQVPGMPAGTLLDFDWALGGNSLVYLYETLRPNENGPAESQIRLSPVFGLNNRDSSAGYVSTIVARAPAGSIFNAISYMPGGPYIATLVDLHHNGCWMVRFIHLIQSGKSPPIDFPGLCVDSRLEHANWQSSGSDKTMRWLVVTGYPADPVTGKPFGTSGMYALVPSGTSPTIAPVIERLADLPSGSQNMGLSSAVTVPVPRVRPSGSSLDIQPRAAQSPNSAPLAPIRPPYDPGVLLAGAGQPETASDSRNAILRIGLDGSGKRAILPSGAVNSCPTWSPDGRWVAFTSHPAGNQRTEIFVMDSTGSFLTQLTLPDQPSDGSAPGYRCPVWSPDGKVMAAISQDTRGARLVIIGRTEGVLRSVLIDSPSKMSQPVWAPDGKTILLAEEATRSNSAYIVSVDREAPVGAYSLRVLSGWKDVLALSLSPDGKQLALVATRAAPNSNVPITDFLVFTMGEATPKISEELPGYSPQMQTNPGRMAWLSNNQVLFAQPANRFSNHKAAFIRLDLNNSDFHKLAFSEDTLYDWDIKNSWLVYSSESGIWAQRMNQGEPASTLPYRLSDKPVTSLDLK